MRQTQEIYFVIIIGIVLGLLLVGFIVTILFLYQRRQRKQELELVRLKDMYEKEALLSQLEIQENTFKNIGQELHDNIGQMLSVVKLSLSVLPIEKEHQAYLQVQNSKEVLNKAIVDLSNLTKSLHTDRIIDVGLVESIRFELYALQRSGIIQVQFQANGTETAFDEQKSIFIFRIFQEVLNNTIKHSKATRISVNMDYGDYLFTMTVEDNGSGFDLAEKRQLTHSGSGVGLRSLYNRASIIGADLNIDSQPGVGTIVTIELPLPSEPPIHDQDE